MALSCFAATRLGQPIHVVDLAQAKVPEGGQSSSRCTSSWIARLANRWRTRFNAQPCNWRTSPYTPMGSRRAYPIGPPMAAALDLRFDSGIHSYSRRTRSDVRVPSDKDEGPNPARSAPRLTGAISGSIQDWQRSTVIRGEFAEAVIGIRSSLVSQIEAHARSTAARVGGIRTA